MIHPSATKYPCRSNWNLSSALGALASDGSTYGRHHFQAVGVQASHEVFAAGVGLRVGEQAVVQAHFGAHGRRPRRPR